MSEEQNMPPQKEEKMSSSEELNTKPVTDLDTSETMESPTMSEKPNKKSPLLMIVGGFVVALIIGFGIFYGVVVAQVKNLSKSDFTLKTASLFNIPIASINGQKVSYTEYIDNINAMETFYKTDTSGQQAPAGNEVSDFILSRLLVNNLISQVAKDMSVSVSQADIDKIAQDQIIKGFPSKDDAEKEIMGRYGWTFDQFLQKIVYPTELEKQVATKYATEHPADTNADESVRTQAMEILQKIKDGADFAEMAKQYGSDGTKDQGGDLGWFSKGQMVPEFETAAFALKKGELDPDLVKTQYGYHILQVTDKRTTKDDTGNSVDEIQARHILFPVQDTTDTAFRVFINDKLKNAKIDISANVHNPFEGLFDTTSTPVTDSTSTDNSGVTTDTGANQ